MENEFILHPNLPNAHVSAVVLSRKYRCFEASLHKLHIETIYLPENPDLMPAVAGHADLSLLHAGGNTFFVTQSIQAFSDVLAPFGAHVEYAEKKSGLSYPDDAFLNLCILGDYVIANEKSADKHVLDWLLRKRRLISVRQGLSLIHI